MLFDIGGEDTRIYIVLSSISRVDSHIKETFKKFCCQRCDEGGPKC